MFGSKFGKLVRGFALALLVVVACPAAAFAADGSTGLQAGRAVQVETESSVPAGLAYTNQTVPMNVASSSAMALNDGNYFIASAQNTQQVVNAVGGNAVLSNKTYEGTQIWTLKFDKAAQAYYVRNAATGKYLTVQSSSATDYANVFETTKIKDKKNKKNNKSSKKAKLQQWKIVSTAQGYTLASAANSKLYLTIQGQNASLVHGGEGQQFFWIVSAYGESYLPGGYYTMSTSGGSLVTVPGSATWNGCGYNLEGNQSLLSQIFEFESVGGFYKITNVNSGKSMTAMGGGFIGQQPFGNKKIVKKKKKKQTVYKGINDTQLWRAELVSGGKVRFWNKATGELFTLGGVSAWTMSPSAPGISMVGKKALWKANTRKSKTKYCIVCDLKWHEVFVFEKMNRSSKSGPWKLVMNTRVSSGAKGTWTYAKDSTIRGKHYNDPRFNCFYWTDISGTYFHSLLYASNYTPNRVTDGRLGMYISHGCIRMKIQYAKWIFNNCGKGTAVSRYY